MTWTCWCEACGHSWPVALAEDSDPDVEEIDCPECGSDLISSSVQ